MHFSNNLFKIRLIIGEISHEIRPLLFHPSALSISVTEGISSVTSVNTLPNLSNIENMQSDSNS